MLSKKVRLIEWPLSQVCMECHQGQFVDIEDKPSCYICHWDRSLSVELIPSDCPESIPLLSEWKGVFYVCP